MPTTKVDLLRDIIIDALIDLDFDFDLSDDGDADSQEVVRNELVEDMLSPLNDFDAPATGEDFTVRVQMDKTIDTKTEYGKVKDEPITKESVLL